MKQNALPGQVLGRLDFNRQIPLCPLTHYWCRVTGPSNEAPNTEAHKHSFFECHIPHTGWMQVAVDDRVYTVRRGEYLLLPPGRVHRIIEESADFSKLVWGFLPQDPTIAAGMSQALAKAEVCSLSKEAAGWMEMLLLRAEEETYGGYAELSFCLQGLFLFLLRWHFAPQREESYVKTPMTEMQAVRDFLKDNLALRPTAKSLSAQFYMTAEQLERLCRRTFHTSVYGLRVQVQMEKIKELLAESDAPLSAIAAKVGFADAYSMGKFFKKQEGIPPAKYRRDLRKT